MNWLKKVFCSRDFAPNCWLRYNFYKNNIRENPRGRENPWWLKNCTLLWPVVVNKNFVQQTRIKSLQHWTKTKMLEHPRSSPPTAWCPLSNSLKTWRASLLIGSWDSTAIGTNLPYKGYHYYHYYYYYYKSPFVAVEVINAHLDVSDTAARRRAAGWPDSWRWRRRRRRCHGVAVVHEVAWPWDRIQQLDRHRGVAAAGDRVRRPQEVERLAGARLGDGALDEVDDAGRRGRRRSRLSVETELAWTAPLATAANVELLPPHATIYGCLTGYNAYCLVKLCLFFLVLQLYCFIM